MYSDHNCYMSYYENQEKIWCLAVFMAPTLQKYANNNSATDLDSLLFNRDCEVQEII